MSEKWELHVDDFAEYLDGIQSRLTVRVEGSLRPVAYMFDEGYAQMAAAAPELLEALRQLGNEANDAIDAEDLNLIRTETLTEALQAISKATNPQHKAKA